MSIGQRVRERRKELNLTQEELAKRLGNSSRASICTVEKDREDLTTTRIAKLANALETSPAYLMGWTDEKNPDFVYETKNTHILLETKTTTVQVSEQELRVLEAYRKYIHKDAIESILGVEKEN